MARPYSSKISANCRIAGTESRLARVFGWLTTDHQIERLIFNLLSGVIDPLESAQFALTQPREGRGRNRCCSRLRQIKQILEESRIAPQPDRLGFCTAAFLQYLRQMSGHTCCAMSSQCLEIWSCKALIETSLHASWFWTKHRIFFLRPQKPRLCRVITLDGYRMDSQATPGRALERPG